MAQIERSALVAYSDQQMFDLVNQIERYPSFMPGCIDAKVLDRGDGWLEARLTLSSMGVHQSFTTRNTLNGPSSMTMALVDGPFSTFDGEWTFTALNDSACKVNFKLEFTMANKLVTLALSKVMEQVASDQVSALCQQAKKEYG